MLRLPAGPLPGDAARPAQLTPARLPRGRGRVQKEALSRTNQGLSPRQKHPPSVPVPEPAGASASGLSHAWRPPRPGSPRGQDEETWARKGNSEVYFHTSYP